MAKRIFLLAVLALLVSLSVGCGETAVSLKPIDLVPDTATVLGHIDLDSILSDQDLTGLYDQLPKEPGMPERFDEALDLLRDKTRIDLRDFKEVIFFGSPSSVTADAGDLAVFASGPFTEAEVIAAVEAFASEELNAGTYKGTILYTGSQQEAAIAFLGNDAFVLGPADSVRQVIDVKEGDRNALSGDLRERYNDIGDVLVKTVAALPAEEVDKSGNGADLFSFMTGLSFLDELETVEMVLDKQDQAISFELELCFTSEDSAEALENLINIVKLLPGLIPVPEEAPGGVPIPEEGEELLFELLDRLEVETLDSCLMLTLEVTVGEIEELLAEG